eukprot:987117-Pyramimonas_sp.AAC.1
MLRFAQDEFQDFYSILWPSFLQLAKDIKNSGSNPRNLGTHHDHYLLLICQEAPRWPKEAPGLST